MDELKIYCAADAGDKLVISSDQTGLYIETIMGDVGDGTPCILLNVETAIELRDALSRWIGGEQ